MRVIIVAAVVAIVGAIVFIAYRGSAPRSASTRPTPSVEKEPQPIPAARSARVAPPPPRALAALGNKPLPRNVDDLNAIYPGLRENLKRVPAEYAPTMILHRLEMIPVIGDCVAGRIKSGMIQVELHFKWSADHKMLEAEDIIVKRTNMAPQDNDLATKCISLAFNWSIPASEGLDAESDGMIVHDGFRFPVSDDRSYAGADVIAQGRFDLLGAN